MTKFVWLCHAGGGNLPPSLGIARALERRGHSVVFAVKSDMMGRIDQAGFRSIGVTSGDVDLPRYSGGPPAPPLACYLTSPNVSDELKRIIEMEQPDALLVDAMFPAALAISPTFGLPTVVFSHTFLFRQLETWRNVIAQLGAMRVDAGFDPLPDADTLWLSQDRMIVTSVKELEAPALPGWEHVRHVGPIIEDEKIAQSADLPWDVSDPTPLALVSFATAKGQFSQDKIQRVLNGLANAPIHVVATTGLHAALEDFRVPENAVVLKYAAHDPILRRAALCVTHGGHGTLMRSLIHGVPMIVLPGAGHDQVPNSKGVEEWGVGKALTGNATATEISNAAQIILGATSFTQRAKELGKMISRYEGPENAATEIEAAITV
ncbi:hypothetical protein GV827_21420 [Sulfitobacter sp. JBTF-M27]|uniref:Erythromycin biosynthesis protein CIII-like C-terminal domain-containing protein n=1 Tax=Sulfitobacter sediminilitoris TaxID=2698830 RepID=A0A6P0CKF7_9RHOB|nr:glycosyltransferase [Sulfitobacter sediminilitoris]NEK24934.1 hypothetical protein [Sulfitobacter sediminilitoris]